MSVTAEVGVNYILEGSVQKAGDQVRVTAQLINGTNDDHIWADKYDRSIEEIFVVQSEIAQNIAQELKAIFNPDVIEVIEKIPTANMEAYEYYLRGLEVHEMAEEENDIKQAGYLYQKAIDIDPDYADPYLGLARCYADLHWRLDNHQEVMDTVISIVDKAIELEPENSNAWSYKGYQQIRDKMDYLNNVFEAHIFNFAGGNYYDMVRLNTLIGNKEEALEFLQRIEDAGYAFGSISWAMVDPLLEELRDEPEFMASIERGWEQKWKYRNRTARWKPRKT